MNFYELYFFNCNYSFKINEINTLTKMPKKVAISYLLLWDCILNFCAQAPSELRSIYARWITENEYDGVSKTKNVATWN